LTQGFTLAGQALYYLSHVPTLILFFLLLLLLLFFFFHLSHILYPLCFSYFSGRVLHF
jgi:hypothetical protein